MAKTRVIGLDIGTTMVRAAELEFGSGAPTRRGPATLVRYGEAPLPIGAVRDGEVVEQPLVALAIRGLWASQKFASKNVVIGVGNQRVVVRELAVPAMPMAQVRATLPFQVQELLPMSTDEALLDFYPVEQVDGENGSVLQGLLVAAVRDTVSANVLAVESAGLLPTMVDLNALALLRAMVRGTLGRQTVALVDVGARVTDVVIASHGVPRFIRTVPMGGQDVTDAIARAMGISLPEADALKRHLGVGFGVPDDHADAAAAVEAVARSLVEAIRNTFVYYSGNNPGQHIEAAVLTGGGAHLPGFGQYLATATRLEVKLGDPLETVTVARSAGGRESFVGHESLMALPLGLAYGVAA